MCQIVVVSVLTFSLVGTLPAQDRIEPVSRGVIEEATPEQPALIRRTRQPELYRLGPDDLVVVRVLEFEQIPDEPVRIDRAGYIRLPMIGRIRAEGLTVEELAAEIRPLLKDYLIDPQVTVAVAEFRPRPVSVLGAVNNPGVLQLHGPKTLWEVLSEVGGLRRDAGETIRVSRRLDQGEIPHPDARIDRTGQNSVVEFDRRDVVEMRSPETNIEVMTNDVVSVSEADIVYVVGRVRQGGGFAINGSISLLEALSLAGGTDAHAKKSQAVILRVQAGTDERQAISVDLKALLRGKGEDITLRPKDILFVPHSGWKEFGERVVQAGVAAAASSVIYWGIRGDLR